MKRTLPFAAGFFFVLVLVVVPTALVGIKATCTGAPAGDDPGPSGDVQPGHYESTAYGPPWDTGDCSGQTGMQGCGITSGGTDLRDGRPAYIIASDPGQIPRGSRVYINPNPFNYKGTFLADDTGGAINHRRLDFYDWKGRAHQYAWGRRTVTVSKDPFASTGPMASTPGSNLADTSSDRLAWPTSVRTISSGFGPRSGCGVCSRNHMGLDIAAPAGAPIHAVLAGTIVFRAHTGGYGNYVCVRHRQSFTTCYAHMSRFGSYAIGDIVPQDATLGYVGSTGNSTGPHLHFEVRLGPGPSSTPVDPAPYLQGAASPSEADPMADPSGCGEETEIPAVEVSASGQAYPLRGTRGTLIGRPYSGTHTLGNWQSDNAIDLGTPNGTIVQAIGDCTVRKVRGGYSGGASRMDGHQITLDCQTPKVTVFYTHLMTCLVHPGQKVRAGQALGRSGSANGVPHLHLGAQPPGSPLRLLGIHTA